MFRAVYGNHMYQLWLPRPAFSILAFLSTDLKELLLNSGYQPDTPYKHFLPSHMLLLQLVQGFLNNSPLVFILSPFGARFMQSHLLCQRPGAYNHVFLQELFGLRFYVRIFILFLVHVKQWPGSILLHLGSSQHVFLMCPWCLMCLWCTGLFPDSTQVCPSVRDQ